MDYKYVKGVRVSKMPKASLIQYQTKEPAPFPAVSDGYERLAQTIFVTQINNMMTDLAKEMVEMKSK